MKKNHKIIMIISLIMIFIMIPSNAYAMHIAEGMLPLKWCIIWGIAAIPFVVFGLYSIKKKLEVNSKAKILLAMCGAYCFLLSALKLPSVTGSSSHPTGTGLGTVIFGPAAMAVLGLIVLIFQAILLAHGGISTLGANTVSMAIVGPLIGFVVYKLCKKTSMPQWLNVFLTAFIADLSTYIVTSFQLAVVFNNSNVSFGQAMGKFLTVFAVTQIPLAIVEGILTVLVYKSITSLCRDEVETLANL